MDFRSVERLCAQGLHLKMFLGLEKQLKKSLGIWDKGLK